jgi:hypothetical protein
VSTSSLCGHLYCPIQLVDAVYSGRLHFEGLANLLKTNF